MNHYQTLRHGPVRGYRFGYSPIPWVKPVPVWCYWVDDLLIDTAQRHRQSDVLTTFARQTIDQIVLTHFHEDHAGNATALRAQHQCPVWAGALTASCVAHRFSLLPYERFWFGPIDPCPGVLPLPALIETAQYQFQPIHTPGHSPDHHVLLEAGQGWLMTGDFYIGNLKIFRRGENIYQMMESTRRILSFDFEVVFCGHNPVLKNGRQAVVRKLHYLETLVERVLAAHGRGLRGKALLRAAGLAEQWWLRAFTGNDVSATYIVDSILNDAGSAG